MKSKWSMKLSHVIAPAIDGAAFICRGSLG